MDFLQCEPTFGFRLNKLRNLQLECYFQEEALTESASYAFTAQTSRTWGGEYHWKLVQATPDTQGSKGFSEASETPNLVMVWVRVETQRAH